MRHLSVLLDLPFNLFDLMLKLIYVLLDCFYKATKPFIVLPSLFELVHQLLRVVEFSAVFDLVESFLVLLDLTFDLCVRIHNLCSNLKCLFACLFPQQFLCIEKLIQVINVRNILRRTSIRGVKRDYFRFLMTLLQHCSLCVLFLLSLYEVKYLLVFFN